MNFYSVTIGYTTTWYLTYAEAAQAINESGDNWRLLDRLTIPEVTPQVLLALLNLIGHSGNDLRFLLDDQHVPVEITWMDVPPIGQQLPEQEPA